MRLDPPRSLRLRRSFRESVSIYPRSTPDYAKPVPLYVLPKQVTFRTLPLLYLLFSCEILLVS